MRLALEADRQRNLHDGRLGPHEQDLGTRNAPLEQVVVGAHTHCRSELCGEVHAREARGARDIFQSYRLTQVGFDVSCCQPQAPQWQWRRRRPNTQWRRGAAIGKRGG